MNILHQFHKLDIIHDAHGKEWRNIHLLSGLSRFYEVSDLIHFKGGSIWQIVCVDWHKDVVTLRKTEEALEFESHFKDRFKR